MTIQQKTRFAYSFFIKIAKKYTLSLLGGFLLGVFGSIGIHRLSPIIMSKWFHQVKRIGIVGEFTPTTLPISIQHQISTGLTEITSNGLLTPALALSWEVTESGKIYTFYLDKNVSWHNKKPLLANDVNYNIKRVTFSSINEHTLQASLDVPFSPFLTLVAKPIFQRGLRGLGDYYVDSILLHGTNVQQLSLVPFKNKELPNMLYRFYRTETQALTAFQMGDVDYIEDISDIGKVKQWPSVTVKEYAKNDRIVTLYFNVRNGIVSDKNIRQALAYAIPEFQNPKVFSPIQQNSWAYSDKIRKYTYDRERSKKMILSAKIASTSASLTITTFSQYIDTAQQIAKSWNELGINTTVKVENTVPSDYQVLLSAQDIAPDPDQYQLWHSTQIQTQTNITGYSNVKIDKLLEDGRQEFDSEKRKKIYSDFQRYLTEDVPAVFLYHPKLYSIERNRK